MGRNRAKISVMRNSVRHMVLAPEKIDLLLHGQVLRNPPLPKESDMLVKKTLGEQLREKLDAASKREALNNTLNAWDQDEQKQIKGELMTTTTQARHLFGVTNNASRDTFNYIRDNPGLRIAEIKKGLQQHKETTVSSLVYQMVMADMIRKDDNTSGFHTVVPAFVPYNIGKIRKEKMQARRAEELARTAPPARKIVIVKRKTSDEAASAHDANVAGIGALPVKADPQVKYTFKEHAAWKPEDTVDTLTLMQAKAVHAYLQKLFGAL
jgi:hypothetical protein